MRQYRISRHVTLESLYEALSRKFRVSQGIQSLADWEGSTHTQQVNHKWNGITVAEVEQAITGVHLEQAASGSHPPTAEVRREFRPARRTSSSSLSRVAAINPERGEFNLLANDAALDLERLARGGAALVRREDFEPFWMDRSVSISTLLALFDIEVKVAEAMAREWRLPIPKPFDEVPDDRPDPRLDGLTAAQRGNSGYVRSNDDFRMAMAKFCEERGIDRPKLIRLYDTHPVASCVGYFGGHHQFYTALGVFDIPLRRGGHYAATDHPEEWPPHVDPRRVALLNSSPPSGGRSGPVFVNGRKPEPEPEATPEPAPAVSGTVIDQPRPGLSGLRAARAATDALFNGAPAEAPAAETAPEPTGGYSLASVEATLRALEAQRALFAGADDEDEAEIARLRRQIESRASAVAALDLKIEAHATAAAALRALEASVEV